MVRWAPGLLGRDMPPFARPSLGSSVAGLHAAFGTVLALLARVKNNGKGSTVDVTIIERWDGYLTPFHTAQRRN